MSELGWHFVNDTLRDGSPIPADGEWLEYDGPCVICESGLHYSKRAIDALKYAPGNTICRVEVSDIADQEHDKGVAARRRILWRVDGAELLRDFARRCALNVVHLWDAPEVVVRYLKTGRDTACAAALASEACAAARDAAWAKQNRRLTSMINRTRRVAEEQNGTGNA